MPWCNRVEPFARKEAASKVLNRRQDSSRRSNDSIGRTRNLAGLRSLGQVGCKALLARQDNHKDNTVIRMYCRWLHQRCSGGDFKRVTESTPSEFAGVLALSQIGSWAMRHALPFVCAHNQDNHFDLKLCLTSRRDELLSQRGQGLSRAYRRVPLHLACVADQASL